MAASLSADGSRWPLLLGLEWVKLSVACLVAISTFVYFRYNRPVNGQQPSPAEGIVTIVDGNDSMIDIVAVHGIDGHWENSWVAPNEAHWLKDFLPADVPRARILTYGYDARTHGLDAPPQQYIRDIGKDLVGELTKTRQDSQSVGRPIIWVAHSLGGWVLKSALTFSNELTDKNLIDQKDISLSTYSILFIGCPHQGGNGVGIAICFARLASIFVETNLKLLQVLRCGNAWLRENEERFMAISDNFKILNFYETYPMKFYGLKHQPVTLYSAKIPGKLDAEDISLPGDHKSMVKFRSRDEKGYRKISRELRVLIESYPEWKVSKENNASGDFNICFDPPYERNTRFCCRDDETHKLRDMLNLVMVDGKLRPKTRGKLRNGIKRRVVTLTGLGGVGKSQLALEHAYEYASQANRPVFWLRANSDADLDASISHAANQIISHYSTRPVTYRKVAFQLGLPEDVHSLPSHCDTAWNRDIVRKWLAIPGNDNWLVVIDNSDNINEETGMLERPESDILPKTAGGSVIVTTRLRKRASLEASIEIKEMDVPSGYKLLLKSAKLENEPLKDHVIADAKKLVKVLGGLPIALDQAGAYIDVTQISFATYLELLKEDFGGVSQEKLGRSGEYYAQPAFYSTWSLSFKDIKKRNPKAANLLLLCAFLSNADIPQELLRRGKIYEDNVLRSAILTLVSYSLVKGVNSLTIHLLAHKWAQHHLPEKDQQSYTKMAISMVASALPTSEGKTEDDWSFLQLMQPHLFACLENLDGYLNNEVLDWETSLAVYKLGIVFDDLTLYKFAGTPYTKSLQGLDHAGDEANAVKVRHSLGQNLSWRALYNDSLEYLHPVLRETSTAHYAALYSVGLVYRYQGKYDEALKTLKESHDGYAKVHGEYYSKLLEVKQEIGYVYLCKNEVDTALEWYWPTLAAQENSLGKSHQTTLKTVHGIACAFRRQGKFEETIAWYERALEGREQKLGKEHLQTLATVDGLAETYLAMGRYEEALQGFQRALEGRVKASGNDSMWTLTAVHSVGCALRALCRYPEALEYLERALNGRRKFLGDRHPQTLETVSALFALYPCMEGKERDAEKLRKEYADIS